PPYSAIFILVRVRHSNSRLLPDSPRQHITRSITRSTTFSARASVLPGILRARAAQCCGEDLVFSITGLRRPTCRRNSAAVLRVQSLQRLLRARLRLRCLCWGREANLLSDLPTQRWQGHHCVRPWVQMDVSILREESSAATLGSARLIPT